MSIGVLVILATLLVFTTDPYAQDITIGPLKNSNPGDVSSVSAECETSPDGRQMTCSLIQIRVDLVKTQEAATAELERQLREIDSQEMGKSCKDQRKEMTDIT
jgi:hypothetical protein